LLKRSHSEKITGSLPVLATKKQINMEEIMVYGIMFTTVLYFTVGICGGFDTDKDNPWKKK